MSNTKQTPCFCVLLLVNLSFGLVFLASFVSFYLGGLFVICCLREKSGEREYVKLGKWEGEEVLGGGKEYNENTLNEKNKN